MVKATFGIVGREMILSNTAPTGATYIDPIGANKPFDSFTGTITVDGVEVASVSELSLTLDNGIEPRFVVFDDKTRPTKIGRTRVTGQLTAYFENSELLLAFNGGVHKNLGFGLTDLLGNTYDFELPNIVVDGGQTDVSGESDITLPIPFSAIYDSALTFGFRIIRTDA